MSSLNKVNAELRFISIHEPFIGCWPSEITLGSQVKHSSCLKSPITNLKLRLEREARCYFYNNPTRQGLHGFLKHSKLLR